MVATVHARGAVLSLPTGMEVVVPEQACRYAWRAGELLQCTRPEAPPACGVVPEPGDVWDASCTRARMSAGELALLQVPIAVNEAPIAELESLPGVGPVLAQRMLQGRPYAHLHDLLRVAGIGPKKLARMRARLKL